MNPFQTLSDEARLLIANIGDTAADLATPSLRIGVTGLARAGKTVFITALVHNLVHGGRLPLFAATASGRLSKAYLQPQPDDAVPRFDYESHAAALINERVWPHSTRQISELRLTLEYESASYFGRVLGSGKLHLDIIDYPGEWLLDLPLLKKSYATFSAEALQLARTSHRAPLAEKWLSEIQQLDPATPENEAQAQRLAQTFKDYLQACRADTHALSMLPPGRFLMPGDLDGSPALTFAPLDIPFDATSPRSGTLHAMMERRYEAYKSHVIRPFFRDHFARLDRQIVLVDALNALNAGPAALNDLQSALGEVLTAFRPGKQSWLGSILTKKIDRILFAATKADHVHRDDHDRLQKILRLLVARGIEHAQFKGADVQVQAMAAVRATREAMVKQEGEELPAILGTPLPRESIDGRHFDGETEIAMFPGDLPHDPTPLFTPDTPSAGPDSNKFDAALRFLRFRPPATEKTLEGMNLSLPHIRLDRALEFLIGDRLT